MKRLGKTVFIVSHERTDYWRSCSNHPICGGVVAKVMEVIFWLYHDFNCEPDELGIAVNAINNDQ